MYSTFQLFLSLGIGFAIGCIIVGAYHVREIKNVAALFCLLTFQYTLEQREAYFADIRDTLNAEDLKLKNMLDNDGDDE